MTADQRSLTRRLIAFLALDEFMPIFPVYALLFADSGLSTSEISSLLVLWSVVTFVLEVPSGAWADVVSRRLLLCLSSAAYGVAFATWMIFPTPAGFAAGFVLWGLSSALSSGTFQALAYDELTAIDARHLYARVMGVGTSLTLAAMALATLIAAPLVALGWSPPTTRPRTLRSSRPGQPLSTPGPPGSCGGICTHCAPVRGRRPTVGSYAGECWPAPC